MHHFKGYTSYDSTLIDLKGRALDKDMSRQAALDYANDVHQSGVIEIVLNRG